MATPAKESNVRLEVYILCAVDQRVRFIPVTEQADGFSIKLNNILSCVKHPVWINFLVLLTEMAYEAWISAVCPWTALEHVRAVGGVFSLMYLVAALATELTIYKREGTVASGFGKIGRWSKIHWMVVREVIEMAVIADTYSFCTIWLLRHMAVRTIIMEITGRNGRPFFA
jgi:hypothetical protein